MCLTARRQARGSALEQQVDGFDTILVAAGGGGFIGGGSYEDCDLWADGSFWHRWTGWGPFAHGGGAGRVCDGMPPVPTDNDTSNSTWLPP